MHMSPLAWAGRKPGCTPPDRSSSMPSRSVMSADDMICFSRSIDECLYIPDGCPRRAGSLSRLGDQLLELAVEHDSNFRDAGIPELTEERGRPVVFDAGLPSLVLIDEHPQRSIEAGPNVVL